MVSTRYHLEYPQAMNPRIQNIISTRYTGPKVEFIMLCSILRLAWYMGIILNPINGIEHPMVELKKIGRKKEEI